MIVVFGCTHCSQIKRLEAFRGGSVPVIFVPISALATDTLTCFFQASSNEGNLLPEWYALSAAFCQGRAPTRQDHLE
ncbi:MAG: hypothetical protein WD356_08605 [Pseudomonadales bacterium]